MRATFIDWDDDHHQPVDVRAIIGYFEAVGPHPATMAINHRDLQARLSFSVVGKSCNIDIERGEWSAIRDRIDSLFNEEA